MVVATSATRKAHRMLADARAMEEQHERHNPVNPKSQLMKNKNGVGGMPVRGSGATPSMGLSQFRGGKKHTLLDHLEDPMMGFGTKKGMVRKTARKAYEPSSEAHEMGKHLASHIMSLHGGAFHKEFAMGFSDHKPVPEAQRAKMMLGQTKKGRSRNNGVPLLSGNVDGVVSGGNHYGEESCSDEEMEGGANTGAYEGHGLASSLRKMTASMKGKGMLGEAGHGMAPKRMVGAGVSARAKIVKEVMAEQGLSMIEASKYVKAHGLYKK